MSTLIGIGNTVYHRLTSGGVAAAVATFIANYINGTATPVKGTGTYTFARTSAASIVDFDDVVKDTLAEEIGFHGQRRGETGTSADLFGLAGSWADFGTGVVVVNTVARTATITSANGVGNRVSTKNGKVFGEGVPILGLDLTFSFYIKALAGGDVGQTIAVRANRSAGTSSTSPTQTITLTAESTRYSFAWTGTGDATTTGVNFDIWSNETSDVSFVIEDIMAEDLTADTNKNPASYIAVGESINHGSNVDNVQYFPTENGNTVNGGTHVVDESTPGATIATPSINKGVQDWEARTNTHEYSENATLGLTSTQGITIADDDAAAPSGEVTADKLTDTGDGITHYGGSATTTVVDTTNYVFSGYFKPGTATVVQMMGALTGFDNQSFVTFDLSGSGAVDEGTSVVKSGIELMLTGYYHCWFVAPADSDEVGSGMFVALTNNVVDPIRLPSYDASGDALHVWGLGTEAGDFQTPYIKTAGAAAATHVVDNLQHDSDNYADVGWFVAHFSITQDQIDNIANTPMVLNISDGAAGEYIRAYIGPADKLIVEVKGSGTAVPATSVAAVTPDTEYKIAATWDRDTPTFHVSFDGATVIDETVANTNLMETASAAEYNVGNFESDLDWNGDIAYIEFGKELLDDAALVSKST